MSGFISEMLELTMPTLERMAATMQRLKVSQDEEKARIVDALDDAQQAMEPIVAAVVGQFDLFMDRIDTAANAAAAAEVAGGGAVAAHAQPPSTNRGVTPLPIKTLKATPRKASGVISKSKASPKVKVV